MNKVLSEIGFDLIVKILDEADVGICISDPNQYDNPLIYINKCFLDMTGYSQEDVLNKNCRFLQGSDTNKETVDLIRQAIQDKTSVDVILKNYKKNGSSFWNNLHISPIFDEGKLKYFLAIQKDITKDYQVQKIQKIKIADQKSRIKQLERDLEKLLSK